MEDVGSAVRVVIADDHGLVREGTRRALERSDDMIVVGEASSGEGALAMLEHVDADVLLLDMSMPGMGGLACLDEVRERHPAVKVVMLSATTDQSQIRAALEKGAVSFVLKSINPLDMPSAVRQAIAGTVIHGLPTPGAEGASTRASPVAALTTREIEILRAAALGHSTKIIARDLWVTEKTVKFHLGNVYRKLGVSNRAGAVRLAFEHGLVD